MTGREQIAGACFALMCCGGLLWFWRQRPRQFMKSAKITSSEIISAPWGGREHYRKFMASMYRLIGMLFIAFAVLALLSGLLPGVIARHVYRAPVVVGVVLLTLGAVLVRNAKWLANPFNES